MAYGDATFLADTPYQGEDYRTAYEGALQQGVFGAADMALTVVSGRNYSVAPGVVYVRGDNYTAQGLYRCPLTGAEQTDNMVGGPIPAPAANPRVHQVIARVYEHESDGLGARMWRLEVLLGVATAGATLDNRNGALALPANAVLLRDLLQASAGGGGAITTRDRRPWARGFKSRSRRTTDAGGGQDFDMVVTNGPAYLDQVNLQKRVEVGESGKLEIILNGSWALAAGQQAAIMAMLDASGVGAMGEGAGVSGTYGVSTTSPFHYEAEVDVAAGSHLVAACYASSSAGNVIYCRATMPVQFKIREVLEPNADNGTT